MTVVTLLLLNWRLSLLLLGLRLMNVHRLAHVSTLHLTERPEGTHLWHAWLLHGRKVLWWKVLLRWHLGWRQVHLHDGRIVGNGHVVDDANVFDVRATEQNVIVDRRLRHDRVRCFTLFCSERSHCVIKKERKNRSLTVIIVAANFFSVDKVHKVCMASFTNTRHHQVMMQIYICVRKRSILLCVLFSFVATFAKQRDTRLALFTVGRNLFCKVRKAGAETQMRCDNSRFVWRTIERVD